MKIISTQESKFRFKKFKVTAFAFVSLLTAPAFAQTTISWTGCTASNTSTGTGDVSIAFNSSSCDPRAAGFTAETVGANTVRVAFGSVSGNIYLRNDISMGGTFNYGRLYKTNNSLFSLTSVNLVAVTTNVSQTITLSAYHSNVLVGSITKSFTSGGTVTLPVSSSDLGSTFSNIDEIRTTTSCATCNGVGMDDIVITSTPLGLDLLSFVGNALGTSNLLQWTTANETDISTFGIEKSADGAAFRNIGIVAGNNQADKKEYSFSDPIASTGKTEYYRLRITEQSGNYKYSDIVAIGGNAQENDGYLISPNPSKNLLYIKAPSSKESVSISIIDLNGRMCKKLENASISDTVLNISDLQPGFYFIQMKNTSGLILKTFKFQKI